ncbi:hypothetical protein LS482_09900 [Sinomicrobium kalidii]|uniref:hypothetical protein n=1 Tax=Sinomicrobium kalidii TaxID=2900738 RepID=UPI001E57297E|nr:hypothetical protein [Sinomicrobium kalidii]UGU18180.1 hypothetical protein LS482_09900 [Sinomicrobium kalidii]
MLNLKKQSGKGTLFTILNSFLLQSRANISTEFRYLQADFAYDLIVNLREVQRHPEGCPVQGKVLYRQHPGFRSRLPYKQNGNIFSEVTIFIF